MSPNIPFSVKTYLAHMSRRFANLNPVKAMKGLGILPRKHN